MSPSRILNILRTGFLVSALSCGLLAALWPTIYPSLSKLDWLLVKLYTRDAVGGFEDAKAQLEAGKREAGIETLTALAEDLEDVRRGDRLSSLRTSVLDLLAASYQADEKPAESLQWTDSLLAYDPRDFVSMLRRVDLLEDLDQPDAAFEQMKAAFSIGSTSGAAQLKFINMLCQRGLRDELAQALLGLGLRGPLHVPLRDWDFRWCTSDKKDFRPRVDLELAPEGTPNRYGAAIAIPGLTLTVKGLRLDLPGGSLASIGKIHCEVLTEDGVATTFTERDIFQTNDMIEDGDLLSTTGDIDPYVILYRADTAAVSGVVGFTASVEARPKLPAAAKALLSGPFDPILRATWAERYGESAVLALENIQ